MERRLTAFLLPVLLVVLVWSLFPSGPTQPQVGPSPQLALDPAGAQPPSRPNGSQDAGLDTTFERILGIIGDPGSVQIEFGARGAAVWRVRLLDQSATAEDIASADRSPERCFALVDRVQSNLASLTLEEPRNSTRLDVDLARGVWTVLDLPDGVRFALGDATNGLTIEKTLRHVPHSRELILTLALVADAERPAAALKGLPPGTDISVMMGGLTLVNPVEDHVLSQNPAIAIGRMVDSAGVQRGLEVQRPDARPDAPTLPVVAFRDGPNYIDFAGVTNRFFGAFLRPEGDAAGRALHRVGMEKWPQFQARATDGKPAPGHHPYTVPVARYELSLTVPEAGQRTELEYRLYLGPKSAGVFGERPEYERYQAVMDVDLAPMCFCDIPGATPMAKLLLWLMRGLHGLVNSWGLAIVLLTLLVRGILVPLNFRMQKSMRAYGVRVSRLKPKLDQLKERYGKDPKQYQQKMVEFQREHKMFPPLGGCLPMFVTIPVFLGLFSALRVAYELRHQPFLGWIHDLSQPDQLFETGWGFMPWFNLLPIIMVALWLVLQMGTPLPTDPQQRQMMKIMRWMPVIFGVMLYNYAAGLMVYMITSSLFGIVEQRVTKKILGPLPTDVGMPAVPQF